MYNIFHDGNEFSLVDESRVTPGDKNSSDDQLMSSQEERISNSRSCLETSAGTKRFCHGTRGPCRFFVVLIRIID